MCNIFALRLYPILYTSVRKRKIISVMCVMLSWYSPRSFTGDVCPVGTYCPEGSHAPTDCPAGTYLNTTENYNSSQCIECTAGYYCSGPGNELPTGKCYSTGCRFDSFFTVFKKDKNDKNFVEVVYTCVKNGI